MSVDIDKYGGMNNFDFIQIIVRVYEHTAQCMFI